MRLVLIAMMVLLVSGCAPSTVLELRDEATPVTFTTDAQYQRVFKDLKDELSRCMFGGAMMATTTIDAQLYPDLGEGEISIRYNNMGDRSVFLHVEIIDQGTEGQFTKVTAYPSTFGLWDKAGELVKSFVIDGVPYCPV